MMVNWEKILKYFISISLKVLEEYLSASSIALLIVFSTALVFISAEHMKIC